MIYNVLTAGLPNVILLLAVEEELSSPTFSCFLISVQRIASCVELSFA